MHKPQRDSWASIWKDEKGLLLLAQTTKNIDMFFCYEQTAPLGVRYVRRRVRFVRSASKISESLNAFVHRYFFDTLYNMNKMNNNSVQKLSILTPQNN